MTFISGVKIAAGKFSDSHFFGIATVPVFIYNNMQRKAMTKSQKMF